MIKKYFYCASISFAVILGIELIRYYCLSGLVKGEYVFFTAVVWIAGMTACALLLNLLGKKIKISVLSFYIGCAAHLAAFALITGSSFVLELLFCLPMSVIFLAFLTAIYNILKIKKKSVKIFSIVVFILSVLIIIGVIWFISSLLNFRSEYEYMNAQPSADLSESISTSSEV